MTKALLALAAVLAALAVSIPGAFGRTLEAAAPTATPGVTSSTITIGGTFPLSGPASPYAPIPRGMEAYFKWVNTRKGPDGKKGIRGRQIVWKYYDDGYNPAQTVQMTNKLILEDKIFADVGSLGTEHNQAIRPLLNDRKIPQILVATGASYLGAPVQAVPVDDRLAARLHRRRALVRHLDREERPEREDRDLLPERRLREGLPPRPEDRPRRKEEPDRLGAELRSDRHELRVPARTAKGIRSGHVGAAHHPTPTVRAIATAKALNWKPNTIVINSVAAIDSVMKAAAASAGAAYVNGAISSGYLKNNSTRSTRTTRSSRGTTSLLAQYGPSGADPKNSFYFYGFAKAYDVVKLLYNAGKNPTRASLMKATQQHELGEPVHDQRHQGQDRQDGPLPDLAAEAPSLRQRDVQRIRAR